MSFPLFKTEAIIFRTLKYSESSIICDLYTFEKGMKSYIVSGLSSSKSRTKSSILRHLNIVDVVAYDKKTASLARIKEQKLAYIYRELPFNVIKSSIGLFVIELCRVCIQEEEPNKELYHYIKETLIKIDSETESINLIPIQFLIGLCSYIGIHPMRNMNTKEPYFDLLKGRYVGEVSRTTLDINKSRLLYAMLSNNKQPIRIKRDIRNEFLDDMLMYYKMHIENMKELKTVKVLRQIMK